MVIDGLDVEDVSFIFGSLVDVLFYFFFFFFGYAFSFYFGLFVMFRWCWTYGLDARIMLNVHGL